MAGWTEGAFDKRLAAAMLGVVLAVGAPGPAAASPRDLRFEHLGQEQGLPQESIYNILQDRQGFMWFGTQAGLSRFDGYRMTVYKNDPADPASIPDNFVLSSFEDEQGRLWFGTRGGLSRFERASGRFVRYADDGAAGPAPRRAVSAIVGDGKGGLWLATGDGLKHFSLATGRFTSWRPNPAEPGSLRDDRVTALARDGAGALWVGTASGLARLAPGAAAFEHFELAPAGAAPGASQVLALSMGPRDTLWIGTGAGLRAWRIGASGIERRRVGPAEGMGEGRILTLYHDQGANLWVGTDGDGLKWRDPASARFVSYSHRPLDRHSLPDNQVGSVFVDRTGTLWVGNQLGGVNRADLASGGFRRHASTPGQPGTISNNKIRTIAGDSDGALWLGTSGGGLNRLDPDSGQAQPLRHDPARPGSLPNDVVTALATLGPRLWVGSPTGLAWRDPGTGRFHPLPLGPDPEANAIQYLHAGRGGALWIATRGALHRLAADGSARQSWRNDPADPASLGENLGFALLEDRRGALWIGTDNGLERLDPATGRFVHYRHDPANPAGLRHGRVYALYESRKGDLWVGTAGGLHRLEEAAPGQPRFRFFPLGEAGAADPIGAILEDDSGALWVSNTVGVTRLDPATGQFKNYTAKDGLTDGSYFIGAGYRGPGGDLHFGGVNGLTSFAPGAIRDNPYPPTVLITDLRVLNQPRVVPGGIHNAAAVTLPYRENVLSLEFAALHFADPQRNRYAYQLEGFDAGWIDTGAGKRFATYTNLDPGNYVFRVKASNKDGVWNEAPATLAITITPPVWQTWWLRLLAGSLALAAAYALYRWRVNALLRRQVRLAHQVDARTAELMLQKEAAERRKQEVEQQKEVIEVAHRNISLLSEIGRSLTANLDSESIMLTLYDHVNALMDASVFGVGVYRPERRVIEYPFAVERGMRYLPYTRSTEDRHQLAVWCIEHEREVFINDLDVEYRNYTGDLDALADAERGIRLADGSRPADVLSLLYVPIMAGGRVHGLVTVQSFEPQAYQRIHLDMLRTLAAYVGVAFDNAAAYRQLKDTQAQLVAQEKLAALGSLVAGVAHELNTPVGNSLLMASTLQARTEEMAARFDSGAMRRSDLGGFLAAAQEAAALIMRSLHNAADLVNSFRQVAVDQASAQRRRFNLEQTTGEIVATMMNQVRKAGHTLELELPPGIEMDSFPGPFGQVVINLINNAMLHAFDAPGGRMRLSAELPVAGRVQVRFHDNGRGIAPEHLARIFDPFFTTRLGRGGSGLGLNITYNIVTSLLGGTIRVESGAGDGTTFILDLPLAVVAQNTPHPPQSHEDPA